METPRGLDPVELDLVQDDLALMSNVGRTLANEVLHELQAAGQIENWAVCDGLGMQFLRGIVKTHSKEIFELATQFNHSKDPWKRRLSLVMVEWYTRVGEHHGEIKKLVKNLEGDDEVAWR